MSRLWAITAYFNPCGYRSRRANYERFRDRLQCPLLSVELAFDAGFELDGTSAERVVQLRGGDVMWQKERLLNVALEALPDECEAVAWLDGDVLFSRPDWPEATLEALDHWPLIQPFESARDQLGPNGSALSAPAPSFAASWVRGTPLKMAFRYDADRAPVRRLSAPGFAWAARRDLIAESGFYDRGILGGGDRTMLEAAIGNVEGEIPIRAPSAAHAAHYRDWAAGFHRAVDGRIGCIAGEVVHLWHGDLRNRQYQRRYEDFARFGFDPLRDITLDPAGCWRWASAKPELHAFARELFLHRREDGDPSAEETLALA